MTLFTWPEFWIACATGVLSATAIFPGYWLGARVYSKQVKQLEAQIDGMRLRTGGTGEEHVPDSLHNDSAG